MMKTLIAALMLLSAAVAHAQAPQYTQPSRVVLSHQPRTLAFMNTNTGAGVSALPQATWVDVDVTRCVTTSDPCVPAEATGVLISSLLIITQGGEIYTSDLIASLSSPLSGDSCWNYLGQTVEADPSGGQRSPWFAVAPVVGGKVRFCRITLRAGSFYTPSTGSSHAFGINARIAGYTVP